MNLHEALRAVPLLNGLTDDVIDRLVDGGSTRVVQAAAHLAEEGQDDAGLQILLEGSAEVLVHGKRVATLGPGDYFGEMSVIDGAPRSATVTSGDEGAATFQVSPLLFSEVLEQDPHAARVLLRSLSGRLREAESHWV